MSNRELVVLGTASQAPTRRRNHIGYFLRWDAEGLLFDPGEGTQRQMLFAGVTASQITRICVTHFHGDHCLGLPGVLQRMSLAQQLTSQFGEQFTLATGPILPLDNYPGDATALQVLGHNQFEAIAEPVRLYGGSALVVNPAP